MKRFILDVLISGIAGGVLSHMAAAACSRAEEGRSALPMHAVSHIAWGDKPASHQGHKLHNWVIGSALHHGACFFWATFYEGFFGRRAERSTGAALAGGTAIAAAAYVTDYHVVAERFKPGFEAHVSDRALLAIYAALALGLAAGARLRGLCRHQIEDRNKRNERRHSERNPDAVVAPE